MSRSAQRRRIALSKPRVASPFSGSLIFLWPSAPPHLDFGGRVAPAQFYHTAHNDIGRCPYPQRRECFSRSSSSPYIRCRPTDLSEGFYRRSNDVGSSAGPRSRSAGACSGCPVVWLLLTRSVLISGRSK